MEKQSTIEQLKFPDNIRQNPGLMLGSLNDASLLFREILDNARDELIASKSADTIWLKCDSDFHVVADNGRGINVAISENDPYKRTQMELAVGEIYAGGKYHSDKVQGGMHGVGSSAVNAVSDLFRIACKITPDNYSKSSIKVQDFFKDKPAPTTTPEYYLFVEYQKGIKVNEYVATYEDLKNEFDKNLPQYMSTIVGFTSDLSIVKSNVVNFQDSWIEYTEFVLEHFFNKKVNIYLNGVKVEKSITPYKYQMQKDVTLSHPEWAQVNTHFQMYISFEFNKDLNQSGDSGCVNLVTVNRGVHINYAKRVIKRLLKEVFNIEHDVLDPGLFVNVILLANKVGYDSQTKVRLTYLDGLSDGDYYAFDSEIRQIFNDNYDEIKAHVDALNELAATYDNLSAKEYIHQMINISTDNGNRAKSFQPIKLIDASAPESDRSSCELFLCEGSSASGTIMKVRDPYYHAVMPLKGVIYNTAWVDIEDALQNDEIKDIISAIGTGVDLEYDLDALRYDKIIIATDADADGSHIAALLLGIFASYMRFLLEEGHVYVLLSPFYKQSGEFIYRDELDKLDKDKPFERYKGLGSMNGYTVDGRKEIINVFTNPDTRHLIQVTPENVDLAILTLGDKQTRRRLMENKGLIAKNVIEETLTEEELA